jgi:hypothetical protein
MLLLDGLGAGGLHGLGLAAAEFRDLAGSGRQIKICFEAHEISGFCALGVAGGVAGGGLGVPAGRR